MEVVIAFFIGAWLSGACLLAYRQLKKESTESGAAGEGRKR